MSILAKFFYNLLSKAHNKMIMNHKHRKPRLSKSTHHSITTFAFSHVYKNVYVVIYQVKRRQHFCVTPSFYYILI